MCSGLFVKCVDILYLTGKCSRHSGLLVKRVDMLYLIGKCSRHSGLLVKSAGHFVFDRYMFQAFDVLVTYAAFCI